MKRWMKRLAILPVIALFGLGMWAFNHYEKVQDSSRIHAKLLGQLMETPHAKEFKARDWTELKAMADRGELDQLAGQEIVLAGYGLPANDSFIKDMGSLASLVVDVCCPKPVMYKHVTIVDISPLPYNSYFFQETPDDVTLRVQIADGKAVEFAANSPAFFRGTLQKNDTGKGPRYVLAAGEKLDTSRGSILAGARKTPPAKS
ncbi:MAG: hypothetical protein GC168_13870 [Candidatus Hydrogenedens sp.]|nr:hypothetical protein [Candidatus Hydrogenedens sp.]